MDAVVVEVAIGQRAHGCAILIDQLLELILAIDHQPIGVPISILVVVAELGRELSSCYPGDLSLRDALHDDVGL